MRLVRASLLNKDKIFLFLFSVRVITIYYYFLVFYSVFYSTSRRAESRHVCRSIKKSTARSHRSGNAEEANACRWMSAGVIDPGRPPTGEEEVSVVSSSTLIPSLVFCAASRRRHCLPSTLILGAENLRPRPIIPVIRCRHRAMKVRKAVLLAQFVRYKIPSWYTRCPAYFVRYIVPAVMKNLK